MSDRQKRVRSARRVWAPTAEAVEREIRRGKRRRYRKHRRRVLLVVLLLSLAAGWALYTQALVFYTVHGTGMSPTVESGDVVVCIRQSLLDRLTGLIPERQRSVGRGDLVIVDYRAQDGSGARATLMKRAAGIEGDAVDIVDGILTVNGDPVCVARDGGDRVYPIDVPAGEMFLIGDHTAVAVDSRRRAFGTVPKSAVVARPVAVVWPAYAVGRIE